jgi:hypothetical protein
MGIKRSSARNMNNPLTRMNVANLAAIVAGAWDTSPFSLSYVVVGGGGAAGTSSPAGYGFGGSGGAGGLVQGNINIFGVAPASPITFSITIGAGGNGVVAQAPNTTVAGPGSPTTLVWGANTITALGGGNGANGTATTIPYRYGGAGGSGGAGDGPGSAPQGGGPGTQPAQPSHPSISSQHGNPGGGPHAPSYGAGGGGAGGAGGLAPTVGYNGTAGGLGLRWWADGGVYAYGGNTSPGPRFDSPGFNGISAPPGSGGGGVCSTTIPTGQTSGSGGGGVVVFAMPTVRYILSRGAPGSAIVTTAPPAAPDLTSIKFTSPGTFTLP